MDQRRSAFRCVAEREETALLYLRWRMYKQMHVSPLKRHPSKLLFLVSRWQNFELLHVVGDSLETSHAILQLPELR
jgi:hypothetical protein